MALRVACIGGGPGGLFFSTLFKQTVPDADVVLFERNQATDAFGFGAVSYTHLTLPTTPYV